MPPGPRACPPVPEGGMMLLENLWRSPSLGDPDQDTPPPHTQPKQGEHWYSPRTATGHKCYRTSGGPGGASVGGESVSYLKPRGGSLQEERESGRWKGLSKGRE